MSHAVLSKAFHHSKESQALLNEFEHYLEASIAPDITKYTDHWMTMHVTRNATGVAGTYNVRMLTEQGQKVIPIATISLTAQKYTNSNNHSLTLEMSEPLRGEPPPASESFYLEKEDRSSLPYQKINDWAALVLDKVEALDKAIAKNPEKYRKPPQGFERSNFQAAFDPDLTIQHALRVYAVEAPEYAL